MIWATREFGVPLGIPSIFLYDGLSSGDISAGGGQLYSCRDAARVGQLIASGGVWAVSFQWKNPDFLFKNPDFLLKNPDFLLKNG